MKLRIVVSARRRNRPEVTKQAVAVLQAVSDVCGYEFRFESHRIGGAAIEQDGHAVAREALWRPAWKPTPCCSAQSATQLRPISPARSGLKLGCLRCGRRSADSPIFVPSRRTKRSLTARLCAKTSRAALTFSSSANCWADCISRSRARSMKTASRPTTPCATTSTRSSAWRTSPSRKRVAASVLLLPSTKPMCWRLRSSGVAP